MATMSDAANAQTSVRPVPTDEEAVAIMAATEALWPRPVVNGPAALGPEPRVAIQRPMVVTAGAGASRSSATADLAHSRHGDATATCSATATTAAAHRRGSGRIHHRRSRQRRRWSRRRPTGRSPLHRDIHRRTTSVATIGGERAGFGTRLGAWLLDSLLYGLLSLVFVIPGIVMIVSAFSNCDWVETSEDSWEAVLSAG